MNLLARFNPSRVSFRYLLLAFYVLAVAVRLFGVCQESIQPDELHWQERSRGIITVVQQKNFAHLTTHLEHPGIPPALVMAVGEVVAHKYNKLFGLSKESPGFFDDLMACRIANVIVSSLLIPIVLLIGCRWLGFLPSLLAAIILIFDPIHITLSREAHLDSMLTIFVTTAWGLYLLGEEEHKLSWKMWAGVAWGLALATKPTALALVFGIFLYRFIRWAWSYKQASKVRYPLLTWSDVGLVFVGNAALVFLYTRLQNHERGMLVMKHVHSLVADKLYNFGLLLHRADSALSIGVLLISASIVAGVLFVLRYKQIERVKDRWAFFGLSALGVLAGTVLFNGLFPAVLENLLRFYLRAHALKDVGHVAYGVYQHSVKYGYLAILFSRNQPIVILGLLLFLSLSVFPNIVKRYFSKKQRQAFLLIVPVVLCWVAILSLSSKQTIRYIMPVAPGIIMLSSVGLLLAVRMVVEASEHWNSWLRVMPQTLSIIFTLGLCLWPMIAYANVYPYNSVYANNLSGGVKGARLRYQSMLFAGQQEIVKFLSTRQELVGKKQDVYVVGDMQVAQKAASFFRQKGATFRFEPQRGIAYGRYVVIDWNYYSSLEPDYRKNLIRTPFEEGKSIFDVVVDGEVLSSVYVFPVAKLDKTLQIDLSDVSRWTGKEERYLDMSPAEQSSDVVLTAKPERDLKGYLLATPVSLPKGNIEIRLTAAAPRDLKVDKERDADRYVFRLDLGKDCERIVKLNELSPEQYQTITMPCLLPQNSEYRIKVYWFGNIPVIVKSLEISRTEKIADGDKIKAAL